MKEKQENLFDFFVCLARNVKEILLNQNTSNLLFNEVENQFFSQV